MTTPALNLHRTRAGFSLAADSLIAADGTLWSHAATLGTRFKGSEFCIDQACVQNFVNVFTSGYPQKIPVDYEHASTTDDPEVRKLRAQGMVPKAGDVVELRGVFAADQFTGDLKAAAEKLSAQAGRELGDARNFGLWMRWKPTARALAAVKAGEYTELSIAFDSDLPNNVDGSGQGPGLWAVALLNTPFLDDMLPVAAGRDMDTPPGGRSATPTTERPMNAKLIALVAAVRGKPVSTEDEAITELTAFQAEITELRAHREYREILSAEFENEKDPAKTVAKVRELRAKVTQAETDAAAAKKAGIKTTVDATIKQFEAAIGNVGLRTMMTRELTRELEAGTELEKTETFKTLKELAPDRKFVQSSVADVGGAGAGDDVKIAARADELLEKDPSLKALSVRDWPEAYRQATSRAVRELSVAL
jgi:phage I-like protein